MVLPRMMRPSLVSRLLGGPQLLLLSLTSLVHQASVLMSLRMIFQVEDDTGTTTTTTGDDRVKASRLHSTTKQET